jgi:hypothetical protein
MLLHGSTLAWRPLLGPAAPVGSVWGFSPPMSGGSEIIPICSWTVHRLSRFLHQRMGSLLLPQFSTATMAELSHLACTVESYHSLNHRDQLFDPYVRVLHQLWALQLEPLFFPERTGTTFCPTKHGVPVSGLPLSRSHSYVSEIVPPLDV